MQVRPGSDRGHAILDSLFIVRFNREVSENDLQRIESRHSEFQRDFPRKTEERGQIVRLPKGGIERGIDLLEADTPYGLEFESLARDGKIERRLRISGENIVIGRPDYSNWEIVWPEVRRILSIVLEECSNELSINRIALQYLNRFEVDEKSENFQPETILNPESEWLASCIFKQRNSWRTFQGNSFNLDTPHVHKRTKTTEIEFKERLGDSSPECHLDLRVSEWSDFHEPINSETNLVFEDDDSGKISLYMNDMHKGVKSTLANILAPGPQNDIKLHEGA